MEVHRVLDWLLQKSFPRQAPPVCSWQEIKRGWIEKIKGFKEYDENAEELDSGAYEYHARNKLIDDIVEVLDKDI